MKNDAVRHLVLLPFTLPQAGVTCGSPVPGRRDIRETWERPRTSLCSDRQQRDNEEAACRESYCW